jgi:hypothetical protein
MAPSQITEMIVFHVKEGVELENVASSDPSPAVKSFTQSLSIIKAQRGVIRQFWVT